MAPEKLPEEPTLAEVVEALHRVADHLDANNKLRNIALVTAAVCLLVGIAGILTALRAIERANDARDETTLTRKALSNQIDTNARVVCSTARSTAVARYVRHPQSLPGGGSESTDDFIERMLAQKAVLLAARGLDCSALAGFATFPFLQARALYEIEAALHGADPDRFDAPKRRSAPLIPNTKAGPTASGQEVEDSQRHASEGGHEGHHDATAAPVPPAPAPHEQSEGRHPPAEGGEEDVPEPEAPSSPGGGGAHEAQPEAVVEPSPPAPQPTAPHPGPPADVVQGVEEILEGVGVVPGPHAHLGGREAPLDSAP